MISLLGPPPLSLLAQGKSSHKFFSSEGKKIAYVCLDKPETRSPSPGFLGDFCAEIPLRARISLEQRESALEGVEKLKFLNLIRKMLQWEPGMRSSAKDLAKDEWICQNL